MLFYDRRQAARLREKTIQKKSDIIMQGTQNISAGTAGKPRIPGNHELLQLVADPN